MKKYDYCAYIGRFSPIHLGHRRSIEIALENAEKVIIVIGSANAARSIRNPFTDSERADMIRASFSEEENERIHITTVEDVFYQDHLWLSNTQTQIQKLINLDGWRDKPATVALVGYKKDHTSSYLDEFKHWDYIDTHMYRGENLDQAEEVEIINSTEIRNLYFEGKLSYISGVVPKGVFTWMQDFFQSETYSELKMEYVDRVNEVKKYESIPKEHAINAYTADAVVIQSGHILLIQRGVRPGKGQWALPGGHIKPTENSRQAATRELLEETSIKLQPTVLDRAIRDYHFFDHPERSVRYRVHSPRGRTITVAYFYQLDSSRELPKVKAADDATQAWWFPLCDLPQMKNQLFEDHAAIINYFIHRHNVS